MKSIVVALAGVLAVGVAHATDMPPIHRLTLTEPQKRAVQEGVKLHLRDPDSARFDDSMFGGKSLSGEIDVCGTVNSRNGFGGYTGRQSFFMAWQDAMEPAVELGDEAGFMCMALQRHIVD